MPSLDQVLEFRRKMYEESVGLIKKKGHDYNRKQQLGGNTLFNLTVCEVLGIVDTAEQGILVRLGDKFMRLVSLMAPGVEAAVKDESVRETVRDFHNYLDYALQLWEERRARTAVSIAVTGNAMTTAAYPLGKDYSYQQVEKGNTVVWGVPGCPEPGCK